MNNGFGSLAERMLTGAAALLGVCLALKWAVTAIVSVAVPLLIIGSIVLALYLVLRR